MSDSTVPLAAIGLVTAILALVVTPLFGLLRANTKALNKVGDSMNKVAKATDKGAREAKQRNGHLAELVIQASDNTISTLKNVSVQTVETQVVKEQK